MILSDVQSNLWFVWLHDFKARDDWQFALQVYNLSSGVKPSFLKCDLRFSSAFESSAYLKLACSVKPTIILIFQWFAFAELWWLVVSKAITLVPTRDRTARLSMWTMKWELLWWERPFLIMLLSFWQHMSYLNQLDGLPHQESSKAQW